MANVEKLGSKSISQLLAVEMFSAIAVSPFRLSFEQNYQYWCKHHLSLHRQQCNFFMYVNRVFSTNNFEFLALRIPQYNLKA